MNIGDRISAYRQGRRHKATVTNIKGEWIEYIDDSGLKLSSHYKVCRKLRKRPATRYWALAYQFPHIDGPNAPSAYVNVLSYEPVNDPLAHLYIELKEVRRARCKSKSK